MVIQIGVFGSASGALSKKVLEDSREIGRRIAHYGVRLITGGCTGLPYEAAIGAKEKGGLVAGISPASDVREHVEKYRFPVHPFDFLIFTEMGKKGRNPISLHSVHGAIFIAGQMGTLNEFTIAYDEGKVIGVLTGSGGFSERYLELAHECKKPSQAIVLEDIKPLVLVDMVYAQILVRLRESCLTKHVHF